MEGDATGWIALGITSLVRTSAGMNVSHALTLCTVCKCVHILLYAYTCICMDVQTCIHMNAYA